jgi:ceramide glucosyltransferase
VSTTTILALAPVAISLAIYLFMEVMFFVALARAKRSGPPAPSRAPVVSILKPLAGKDDDLDANLASFAGLDYPCFELRLGVASHEDPAYEAARRFLARHPRARAQIVLTDADAATNPKVAQLIGLEAQAKGEILVVSDSNVRVPPHYLWDLVRLLEDRRVGLVTNVFAGTGERTLGAALENLQIGALVAPGIIACDTLSRRPLTVGKSMAMRKRDLAMLGGFAQVGRVLAEDHALGRLFLAAELEIRTSLVAVENRNVDTSVRRTIERHSRWAKMRRTIAPFPFALEPLASPLAIALLAFALHPSRAQAAMVVVAATIQTAGGFVSARAIRGTWLAWHYLPLEIVRTGVAFGCWAAAWISRRVSWRGHAFVLGAGSEISPAPSRSLAARVFRRRPRAA